MFNSTQTDVTELLKTGKVALVVVDKQHAYFDPELFLLKHLASNPYALDGLVGEIDDFISYVRTLEVPIVWTKMVEDIEHSPDNIRRKMISDQTPSISNPSNTSFGFYGDQPQDGDVIVVKHFYDVFTDSEMINFAKSHPGIKTLILVGGYTSRCLLGTAFSANARDYNVIVVEDLVGVPDSLNNEQEAALNIIGSTLGYRILKDDLKEQLKSGIR